MSETTTTSPWDETPELDALDATESAHDPGPVPDEPGDPVEAAASSAGGALVPYVPVDLLTLDDPARLADIRHALRLELTQRVGDIMAGAKNRRGPQVGARPSSSQLLAEARAAAAIDDALRQLGLVMTEIRKLTADLAMSAVVEVLGEGRRSVKVQDAHGAEVTVAEVQRTETSVDEAAVLDVLGTTQISAVGPAVDSTDPTVLYAAGVRDGIATLRSHLGATLPWKVTELTKTGKALEGADEGALAARLDQAWAKVAKGEPTTSIDVKAPRG